MRVVGRFADMADNALSSAPASQSEEHTSTNAPGADGAGAATNHRDAANAQAIDGASARAVGEHVAGKCGKASRKLGGASVPMVNLADGTSEAPLEEAPPTPLEPWVEADAPFDEALAREGVETVRDFLSDIGGAIVRAVALHQTGDAVLADTSAKDIAMSGSLAERFDKNGVRVAKKYNAQGLLKYLPEFALLACFVAWGKTVSGTVGVLKAKGAELRKRAKEGKA